MDLLKLCVYVVLFSGCLNTCYGLECYVCTNQTANTEKCLNTIKTCQPGEDVCQTEIRWGSTPYFAQGAPKQFYVSKRCAVRSTCEKIRSKYMSYCTHIWYEDWTCSECCRGDRCNYYIISGAPKSMGIPSRLATTAAAILIVYTGFASRQ